MSDSPTEHNPTINPNRIPLTKRLSKRSKRDWPPVVFDCPDVSVNPALCANDPNTRYSARRGRSARTPEGKVDSSSASLYVPGPGTTIRHEPCWSETARPT